MGRIWAGGAVLAAMWLPSPGHAQDLVSAITGGKPILEERLRYEDVDQARFTRPARALTLRTHLGWETGRWNGLSALVEGEAVSRLSAPDFNDGLNHRTLYPGISDPQEAELNRAQLTWAPSKLFTATVGRQRLNIDDLRFVASPGWRQDEQTFDAARADTAIGRFSGTYLYIAKVDRNLGQTADYVSRSHGLTAAYAFAPQLRAEGFVYALDLKPARAESTLTEGVRLTGQEALGGVKLTYAGSYASQTPHAANPASFRIPYWMGEIGAAAGPLTAKADYESLGSDGKRGFSTPLASLHVYQGWADVFTTTPARGVDDFNVSVTYAPAFRWRNLSGPQLFVRHHDFTYAQGAGGLGTEWDAQAQVTVARGLTALIKFADYRGPAAFPSRRKLWLQLDFNL
ncbi:MAG: alginate export family protein [Caulobacteraceae bacterium]